MEKKKYISEIPHLMKEWDWEASTDLDPQKLTVGSNKKAWWICSKCGGKWQTHICGRTGKENKHHTGCPYCASQKVLPGYNDLATKSPNVAKQWHPTKNILKPTEVMPGTSKKVWWICSEGHEYEQAINARVLHPNSCPICSGQRVAQGINDLQSRYPEVAKEWLQEKNGTITPTTITWGSNKKFWWKCSKCGHEWQARVSDRTKGHNGCPACSNRVLVQGVNDLATKFPEVAKEWHPVKNGNLEPKDVKYTTSQKVWWLCPNGHDFLQSIALRTTRKHACPYCKHVKIFKPDQNQKTKVKPESYNLLITHPEISKEWHPTKNGDLTPSDVMAGSGKKVWWLCEKGHSFLQSVSKRAKRGYKCPYCSGEKVWKGHNDLATVNPRLAGEWHPTKNGVLKPTDVTAGSGKRVWWKCPLGHEYQAVISIRNHDHTNCPICALRRSTSFPEQTILYYVKKLWPNSVNKYKDCFDNSMEFDVYIPELKTAIEYDGAQWHKTDSEHKREIKKYEFCKKNEIYLIRVKERSKQQWNDTADKVYYIPKTNKRNYYELEKIILHLLDSIRGLKPLYWGINIEKDKNEILSYLAEMPNSLADMRPDVAAKWNYEKNGNLTPNMFSVSSNEIVWWKCSDCGHQWKSSINSMTRKGRFGCSICAKVQKGKTFTKLRVKQRGSLAEKMPELAKEWHPTKNGDLTPNDITTGRFKPVWWLCPKCGYEWQASPNLRKRGIGCPCCAGRVPKSGTNDLKTKFPDIAKEWDYEKNYPVKPEDVLPKSNVKRWWICSKCGKKWQSTPNARTKLSLPYCGQCKRKTSKSKNQLKFDLK